jgi:transcriptional regulator with XRE-family HTH domain
MSSSSDVAFITPSVLKWALDNSAISRQLVANKLHVDESHLEAWASKGAAAHPPFSKAQELAKLLRIPFGYFFLPEPPKVELPLPDFRGVSASYVPSSEFVELLNDVLLKRDSKTTNGRRDAGKLTISS